MKREREDLLEAKRKEKEDKERRKEEIKKMLEEEKQKRKEEKERMKIEKERVGWKPNHFWINVFVLHVILKDMKEGFVL